MPQTHDSLAALISRPSLWKSRPRARKPQPPQPYYARELIAGYAALYDMRSPGLKSGRHLLLKPGCFTWTLADGHNIRLSLDHDGVDYGSVQEGNLSLFDTAKGLRFVFRPRLDRDGQRIVERMKAGRFKGCSLTYAEGNGHRLETFPFDVVHLDDAELSEICLSEDPKFPETGKYLELYRPDYYECGKFVRWEVPFQRWVSERERQSTPTPESRRLLYFAELGLL